MQHLQALPSTAMENRSISGFIGKLWQIVEDDTYNKFIRWDSNGESFHILDEGVLSKEILPLFYKHNNISSFVRQLNFYGFQKKPSVLSFRQDFGDAEFCHPYFVRGRPELLCKIKRRANKLEMQTRPPIGRHNIVNTTEDVSKVLIDVEAVKDKVDTMDCKFMAMKKENSMLWRELSSLRQKHFQQQQVVHKLVQFLLNMAGRNRKRSSTLAIGPGKTIPAKVGASAPFGLPEDSTSRTVVQEISQCEKSGDLTSVGQKSSVVGSRASKTLCLKSPVAGSGKTVYVLEPSQTISVDNLNTESDEVDFGLRGVRDSLGNDLSVDSSTIGELFVAESPVSCSSSENWVAPEIHTDDDIINGSRGLDTEFDVMELLNSPPSKSVKTEPHIDEQLTSPSAGVDFDLD